MSHASLSRLTVLTQLQYEIKRRADQIEEDSRQKDVTATFAVRPPAQRIVRTGYHLTIRLQLSPDFERGFPRSKSLYNIYN